MKLGNDFYDQDAVTIARKLVGKLLVRKLQGKKVVCRIVETEAYAGPEDKGSHAYQNKRTKRTEIMFNRGGYTYIYLIYGIHYCLNVVTNKKDKPHAVLIRAVEPLKGIDIIREHRKIKSRKPENLTNGPGKLTQALNIDKKLNGYDLINGKELYIRNDPKNAKHEVVSARRINIDYAEEYSKKLWRYYLKGNTYVSVQ